MSLEAKAKVAAAEEEVREASTKESIRATIFGLKPLSKVVNIGSVDIEVRQPSVGDFLAAGSVGDRKAMMMQMLVEYCYVPGTNEKVFEETDVESLASIPAGLAWMDLTQAIDDLTETRKSANAIKKD